MPTWVIGDIHGCWRTLQRLLQRIAWQPDSDELWLVGDLVARGRSSLEVLRWAYHHRHRITAVLGNHDLALLARDAGEAACQGDRLDEVLQAPDRHRLLAWLRCRPLLYTRGRHVMVHAGLGPGWSLGEAAELAAQCSRLLQHPHGITRLWAHRRTRWQPRLTRQRRLAATAALLTRVRVVRPDGRPDLCFTGPPDEASERCRPWFDRCRIIGDGYHVIFGHWAMLGLQLLPGTSCLDSACVWGGSLTALRLEDSSVVQEPCAPEDCWRGESADS